jgi:hypothetical protein
MSVPGVTHGQSKTHRDQWISLGLVTVLRLSSIDPDDAFIQSEGTSFGTQVRDERFGLPRLLDEIRRKVLAKRMKSCGRVVHLTANLIIGKTSPTFRGANLATCLRLFKVLWHHSGKPDEALTSRSPSKPWIKAHSYSGH